MREPLVAVAIAIVIVAACTSVAPYKGASGAQASNTLYCWKDRLVDDSGRLECNWAPTRYDACNGRETSYLEKRLVTTQPSAATRCENGQSLIYVTTG